MTKKVSKGWTNIQSLNIKTSDSVALPIYNSLPENIEEISDEPVKKKKKTKKQRTSDIDGSWPGIVALNKIVLLVYSD